MKKLSIKLVLFGVAAIAIAFFFYYFQINEYFTIEELKKHHHYLKEFVQERYIFSVCIYVAIFSSFVACALPVVIPLAIIGGFLYGTFGGLAYATVSCLIGSIVSFLVLRYVMAHWIRGWHNQRIDTFNQQVQKYGYSYLLMLHFLSIIPMFVINLLAAVANVPLKTIIWVTLIGPMPLNFICVMAGQKLSSIHSFKDIFSPGMMILLGLLAAVACAPVLIRKIRGSLGV